MAGAASSPATVANSLTEKQFQAQVVDLAKLCGFRMYHTFDSRKSESGFPDLVLLRPPDDFLIVELKRQTGRLTDEQRAWLQDLQDARIEAHIWRPSQWPEIEHRLRRRPLGGGS